LFYKNWYDKNIQVVVDILTEEGEFYTFNELKDVYKIRGTYLDYQRLLTNIPNKWKIIIQNSHSNFKIIKRNIHLNTNLRYLIKEKKGCRKFYEVLLDKRDIFKTEKWVPFFGLFTLDDFKTIHTNLINIEEIKLKDFQFKINNKILVTKSFLFKINKVQSSMCSYCNERDETIYHLFCECEHIKLFIRNTKQWINTNLNINLNVNEKVFLLSSSNESDIVKFITILLKYYIYKSKFRENCRSFLTVSLFKGYLKHKFISRKYILKLNKRNETLLATISNLIEILNNLTV
jgi:hypothetical protein